jgi:hypothetical protein
VEHLRAEAIRAIGAAQHVAEPLERFQQAKDGALVEIGSLRQLRQRDLVVRERIEDRERPIHRRHAAIVSHSNAPQSSLEGEG